MWYQAFPLTPLLIWFNTTGLQAIKYAAANQISWPIAVCAAMNLPEGLWWSVSQNFADLIVRGKPTRLMFAVDQFTIDFHIEYPTWPFDQLRFCFKLTFNCIRQTSGLGKIVSRDAIGNADFHEMFSITIGSHGIDWNAMLSVWIRAG